MRAFFKPRKTAILEVVGAFCREGSEDLVDRGLDRFGGLCGGGSSQMRISFRVSPSSDDHGKLIYLSRQPYGAEEVRKERQLYGGALR